MWVWFQAVLDTEVALLLSLKAQYKELTGEDLVGGPGRTKSKTPAQQKKPKEKKEKQKKGRGSEGVPANKVGGADTDAGRKKQTR